MPNTKKPKVKKAGEKGSGLTAKIDSNELPAPRITRAVSAGSGVTCSHGVGNTVDSNNADFQSVKGSNSQPTSIAPPQAGTSSTSAAPDAMDTAPVTHGMDPSQLPLAQTVEVPTVKSGTTTPGDGENSNSNTPKSKNKKKKEENDVSNF